MEPRFRVPKDYAAAAADVLGTLDRDRDLMVAKAKTPKGFLKYKKKIERACTQFNACWECDKLLAFDIHRCQNGCKRSTYCSKDCLRKHWTRIHHKFCTAPPPARKPFDAVSHGECNLDELARTLRGILGSEVAKVPKVIVIDDVFGKLVSGRLWDELMFLYNNRAFFREKVWSLREIMDKGDVSRAESYMRQISKTPWRHLGLPVPDGCKTQSAKRLRLQKELNFVANEPIQLSPKMTFSFLLELQDLEDSVLAACIRAFPNLGLGTDMETRVACHEAGAGTALSWHFDNDNGRDRRKVLSVIYYSRKGKWTPEHGGEFEYIDVSDPEQTKVRRVEPVDDRLVAFWTPCVLHRVRPVLSTKDGPRFVMQMWIQGQKTLDANVQSRLQADIFRLAEAAVPVEHYPVVAKEERRESKVDAAKTEEKARDASSPSPTNVCEVCLMDTGTLQLCAGCKVAYYCSKEHQRLDWALHKSFCKEQRSKRNLDQPD